nr:hypothetical protein BaRGS_019799 [Batillaria attramentaria]
MYTGLVSGKEARIPIPLSTSKDKITDAAGTDLLLKFHTLKAAPQHGSYLAVFDDYEISSVQLGDNFDGVDSMIESFTTACQVELAKDPDNYVTNPETGKSVMKPEISTDICSTICDLHGRCDRGTCVCDQGFTGDNCQLPANQPPVLHRVRGPTVL